MDRGEIYSQAYKEHFEKEATLAITKLFIERMDEMIDKLDRLNYIYMEIRSIDGVLRKIESEIQELKGGVK